MLNNTSQNGFAALLLSILVTALTLIIGASVFFLTLSHIAISRNVVQSAQAFASAEAGIEDALVRLIQGMIWQNPISVLAGEVRADVLISDLIGGSRTIVSTGDSKGAMRKVGVVYAIDSVAPAFFYGAHIGEGGLVMDNLSKVVGNVFSNGTIQGSSGAKITGSAIVAGAGNTLQDVSVDQDAKADSCQNSSVGGILEAFTQTGCTFSSFVLLQSSIASVPLAIGQAEIDEWKEAALAGGVVSGSYELSGSQSATLGPKKIEGNLTLSNDAVLTISGVLWVTGNIDIKNFAQVKLASSYGNLSGVVFADGIITLQNNSISFGSGEIGSYLLYVSASLLDEAIITKNNAIADILFTTQGGIAVENNVQLREATGFKLHLKNSATITYEAGLENAAFVSGPGGAWRVTSWKEVE